MRRCIFIAFYLYSFIFKNCEKARPVNLSSTKGYYMAGLLTGCRKKMLRDMEYTYPVFDAKEI